MRQFPPQRLVRRITRCNPTAAALNIALPGAVLTKPKVIIAGEVIARSLWRPTQRAALSSYGSASTSSLQLRVLWRCQAVCQTLLLRRPPASDALRVNTETTAGAISAGFGTTDTICSHKVGVRPGLLRSLGITRHLFRHCGRTGPASCRAQIKRIHCIVILRAFWWRTQVITTRWSSRLDPEPLIPASPAMSAWPDSVVAFMERFALALVQHAQISSPML